MTRKGFIGHKTQQLNKQTNKQILYLEFKKSYHVQYRQAEDIKTSLKKYTFILTDREHIFFDWCCWRKSLLEGGTRHEKELRDVDERKQRQRKDKRAKTLPSLPTLTCKPH